MQWSEILEQDFILGVFGGLVVNLVDFKQRKITLTVFGRANLARDCIAGTQVKAADLRGGDIDVIRTCQVRTIGRSQESKAVLQYFEDTIATDVFTALGMSLEDGKERSISAAIITMVRGIDMMAKNGIEDMKAEYICGDKKVSGAEMMNINHKVTKTPKIPSWALFMRANLRRLKGTL